MPDLKKDLGKDTVDNLIPLYTKNGSPLQNNGNKDVDAFVIRTSDMFYLSVIYTDENNGYHSRGYAVFNGEKINFTIAANGDASVRERCILAGQQIAEEYGASLEQGKIDACGRFYL